MQGYGHLSATELDDPRGFLIVGTIGFGPWNPEAHPYIDQQARTSWRSMGKRSLRMSASNLA